MRTLSIEKASSPDDAVRQAREYLARQHIAVSNVVAITAPFGSVKKGWDVVVDAETAGSWVAPKTKCGRLNEDRD